MRICCHTNLDLFNEQWPTEFPEVPRVGDEIESMTLHQFPKFNFRLSLEVVAVRWVYTANGYIPEIELHTTRYSIAEFYRYYAPNVGKDVAAFI